MQLHCQFMPLIAITTVIITFQFSGYSYQSSLFPYIYMSLYYYRQYYHSFLIFCYYYCLHINFHFLYVATVGIVSSSSRFLCVITIIIVSITIHLYFYYHFYNRHYLPVMLCVLIPITVVVISIQFFSHYYHCCRRYSHSIIFSLLLGLLSLSPITSFIISVSL